MADFIGCSTFNSRKINYGTVIAFCKVDGEFLGTLELWYRWDNSVAIEMLDDVHDIWAGILRNV